MLGLSPALGAFLGGVLLADSEYRHELESNLEPFKGLLLGLFFISVGMSIAFAVLLDQPLTVAGAGARLCRHQDRRAVRAGHASSGCTWPTACWWRSCSARPASSPSSSCSSPERAGAMTQADYDLLTVVVALSMATTPLLLLAFDRLVGAAARRQRRDRRRPDDAIDEHRKIDRPRLWPLRPDRHPHAARPGLRDDADRRRSGADRAGAQRFGVKVFYGDGVAARHPACRRRWRRPNGGHRRRRAASASSPLPRQSAAHFPDVIIAARAIDRSHAHDLMALGVEVFERETFRSAISLGEQVLVALGRARSRRPPCRRGLRGHDIQTAARTATPCATTRMPMSASCAARPNCSTRSCAPTAMQRRAEARSRPRSVCRC